MKKIISLLVLSLSFTLLSSDSIESYDLSSNVSNETELKNYSIEVLQDWYATTGTTRNTYGTNYSISIRVQGFAGYGNCVSISKVQVSSGGGWSSANYYSVYGEDCTYYVSVGGQSYYFRI
tara:strand:- start:345 stop:707 length:363 start_codon:yes stop_codon:yes gene_type:complete